MLLPIKKALSVFLILLSATAFAQDSTSSSGGGAATSGDDAGGDSNSNLTEYLQNLGKYFGYDITQYCTTGGLCTSSSTNATFSNAILNQSTSQYQIDAYNSYLGALLLPPSSSMSTGQGATIVTGGPAGSSNINTLSALTFNTPPFSSPSGSGVSVVSNIDQQTYQADPVSQAVYNILATPDSSFCMKNDGSWNQSCTYLYRTMVMSQVIGGLPQTDQFFSPDYIQNIVPQLNSDSLMSPMLFSTQSTESSTSSPVSQNQGQQQGLPSANPIQQAANFIRYVTGGVTPLALPARQTYDSLYSDANNLTNNVPQSKQLDAQSTLTDYLTRVRTYAAQLSVGTSNLYYILSKRMPLSSTAGSGTQTSQSLSEYNMATWRLFNPANLSNSQQQPWVGQINTASTATVQKEIALLLAEINYQLYLSRQQQERLLLTESIILIQNAHMNEPDASLSANQGYNNNSGSSSSNSQQSQ